MSDVTFILSAIEKGNPGAAADLLPIVYDELRALAERLLANEPPGQTLQATALVNEAYLRLVGKGDGPGWNSRGHFYMAAARAIRRILIDRARQKRRIAHGGGRRRQQLYPEIVAEKVPCQDLLALNDALVKLAEAHPVKARLVELRYFAGLTGDEAANILGISPKTADRYWVYARAWLRLEMEDADQEKKI